MGIDKSIREDSPVAVIGGTVYHYGRSPEYIPWTNDTWDPPQWIVEHFRDAKDHYCFASEQDMFDFIDGLPESRHPPFDRPDGMSDEERERLSEQVRRWRHEVAERKRAEKATHVLTPADRYTKEARDMIDAVLDRHLRPHEWWDDPEIERQVGLILQHHLTQYREAVGWEPDPTDDIDDDAQPTGYGGKPRLIEAIPVDAAVDWQFIPGPGGEPLLWYAKGTDQAVLDTAVAGLAAAAGAQ